MPNLFDASPKSWGALKASTRMGTYAILDALVIGPKPVAELRPHEVECLADMKAAEWVEETDGVLTITAEGRKHLKSF